MLLNQIALAAVATAFLLVPEITDEQALSLNTPSIPKDLLEQSLEVPCRQCRAPGEHPVNIQLDFSIADSKRLMLNGFELYPDADPLDDNLVATIKGHGPRAPPHEKTQTEKLGYTLLTEPRGLDKQQGMELVDVALRVVQVGSIFVDEVPIVRLGLVRASSGEIVLGNVDFVKTTSTVSCVSMWCRIKSMLDDACRRPKHHDHGKGPKGHHPPPPPHHPPHPPHHPHHPSPPPPPPPHHDLLSNPRWGLFLRDIISHIVLPVLVGVAAGVGVAFLGIFVCGLIYRLATLVGRKCPRAHAAGCPRTRAVAGRSFIADVEEKPLTSQEESTPPPYRDDVKE